MGGFVAPRRATEATAKLAVTAGAVAFGTTGVAHALGPSSATPLAAGAMRIIAGAVALAVFVRATRSRRATRRSARRATDRSRPARRRWRLIVMGGAGVALYQPMFLTGVDRCGVAIGTVVAMGSSPIVIGVWEGVVGRRWPSATWVQATAVAVIGGCVLTVSQQHGDARLDVVGLGCAIAAEIGYLTYASAAKALVENSMDSSVAMTWLFGVGALLLAPWLIREPLGWVLTWQGALMVAYLGCVCTAVAYVLYGYGLRSLPTSTAVTLSLADPLTAAFAGVAVVGERLQPAGWMGAGLLVVGLSMFSPRPTRYLSKRSSRRAAQRGSAPTSVLSSSPSIVTG